MKYLSNIITVLLLALAALFYFDDNDKLKATIYTTVFSPFQSEYKKSTYFEFKVPDEWVLLKDKNASSYYLGATWTKDEKATTIQVLTDYDALADYIFYFDAQSCKNLTASVDINSSATIKTVEGQDVAVSYPAKILFCEDEKDSYVSYSNNGSMAYMIVKPYDGGYMKEYIELFKNIDYKMNQEDIPTWVYEK